MIGGKENPFDPCNFCKITGVIEYEPGTNQVASCPFIEALDSVVEREELTLLEQQDHIRLLRELHTSSDDKAIEFRRKTELDFSGCPQIDYQPLALVLSNEL